MTKPRRSWPFGWAVRALTCTPDSRLGNYTSLGLALKPCVRLASESIMSKGWSGVSNLGVAALRRVPVEPLSELLRGSAGGAGGSRGDLRRRRDGADLAARRGRGQLLPLQAAGRRPTGRNILALGTHGVTASAKVLTPLASVRWRSGRHNTGVGGGSRIKELGLGAVAAKDASNSAIHEAPSCGLHSDLIPATRLDGSNDSPRPSFDHCCIAPGSTSFDTRSQHHCILGILRDGI